MGHAQNPPSQIRAPKGKEQVKRSINDSEKKKMKTKLIKCKKQIIYLKMKM